MEEAKRVEVLTALAEGRQPDPVYLWSYAIEEAANLRSVAEGLEFAVAGSKDEVYLDVLLAEAKTTLEQLTYLIQQPREVKEPA